MHLSLKQILLKLYVYDMTVFAARAVNFSPSLFGAGSPLRCLPENFLYFVESYVYCPYKNPVIKGLMWEF